MLVYKTFFFLVYFQALDWCPFQRNVLASGGGTADRHIRFWNVATGNCLSSIDTQSQVIHPLYPTIFSKQIQIILTRRMFNNQERIQLTVISFLLVTLVYWIRERIFTIPNDQEELCSTMAT